MTTDMELADREWTAADEREAARRGWGLFDCTDRGHWPIEVQKIDTPDEGDAELATDDEAAILLWNAFMTGDPVAQRAMRLLAAFSAGELAWVVGVGLGLEKPWTWGDFADHFGQWRREE